MSYLRSQLGVKDKELFLIVQQAVAEGELWNAEVVSKLVLEPEAEKLVVDLPDTQDNIS